MTDGPRDLSPKERTLIELLLHGATETTTKDLVDQIEHACVVGGIPTLLDLQVTGVQRAAVDDGVVPVRAFVVDGQGQPIGELMVWVTDGYLSGLEYAWYTDEPPTAMPAPTDVRLQ